MECLGPAGCTEPWALLLPGTLPRKQPTRDKGLFHLILHYHTALLICWVTPRGFGIPCALRFSLQLSSSSIRHPNSPTLPMRNNTNLLEGEEDWLQLLFNHLLLFFSFWLGFFNPCPLHIPCFSTVSASRLPYQATDPSWRCSGTRVSACFGNCALSVPKSWHSKSERGLETPTPNCVGSARIPPLCHKDNSTSSTRRCIFPMGPSPYQALLCAQKSPARKISMAGSALACAGDLGIALHGLQWHFQFKTSP